MPYAFIDSTSNLMHKLNLLNLLGSDPESHFIQDIVKEVSNARFNCSPLFVTRYPVGINSRVKAMLLDIESNDVHMVGI